MAEEMSSEQVGESMVDMILGTPAQPEPVQQEVQEQAPEQEEEVVAAKPEEEVETIEIDPDQELFEQELEENGQKVNKKLSLRELQKGYLRQADYTRKTQDLARQRSEAQEQVRQATQESAKKYTERLDQLQAAVVKAIAPELANVDWNKLATEDAFEYVRLSNRARQVQETLQAIEAEKKAALETSTKEEQQKKIERWAKTEESLRSDIPEWGPEVARKLAKAAKDAGATDAEINALDQAWIIKLAHKAAMYDESKEKTSEVVKKVQVVTKNLKPGQKPAQPNADRELVNRWKKSGGKLNQDAADIFSKYI